MRRRRPGLSASFFHSLTSAINLTLCSLFSPQGITITVLVPACHVCVCLVMFWVFCVYVLGSCIGLPCVPVDCCISTMDILRRQSLTNHRLPPKLPPFFHHIIPMAPFGKPIRPTLHVFKTQISPPRMPYIRSSSHISSSRPPCLSPQSRHAHNSRSAFFLAGEANGSRSHGPEGRHRSH